MKHIRDDELLIVREFNAPLALVYRLWEERDHMVRWWGPEGFTTLELDWQLVPGRPWSAMMVVRHYGLRRFGGVIREVQPKQRITFTFQWDEASGRDLETLATVTLAEKDGKTVQTFHQSPFSTVAIRDNHVDGWNSLFNKQEVYVENIAFAEEKDAFT